MLSVQVTSLAHACRFSGALCLLALFAAAGGAAASRENASYLPQTHMYSKGVHIGYIQLDSPNYWGVDCGGYDGASVRAARRRLTVFTALDDVLGYAYPQRGGRWGIVGESLGGKSVKGLAVETSRLRWNVWLGNRKAGYTVGPNGPAAAAALLFVC